MNRRALPLSLLLLAACGHGDGAPVAEPSAVLKTFPAGVLSDRAAAALRRTQEHGHRTGIRIDPPGQHFSTFLVVGEVAEAEVDVLLDALATACANHVRAAGARLERLGKVELGQVSEAVRRAILNRATSDADRGVRAQTGEYQIGGHTGWITLLAVRESGAPDTWRIGGAVHER